MTRILSSVTIPAAVEDVYAFVTTPATWPHWHPSSLGVSEAVDQSLEVGERVTEEFRVAGRRGRVVWTVTGRDAPARWAISGRVIGGGSGVITYRCTATGAGTLFEREFTYSMPSAWLSLLDRLVFRRRVRAESEQAVHQLRQALEVRQPARTPNLAGGR